MERYAKERTILRAALVTLAVGAPILGLTVSVQPGTFIPITIEAPHPVAADCEGPPPRPDLDGCGDPLPTPTQVGS